MHDEHSAFQVEVSPQYPMVLDGGMRVLFLLMPGILMKSRTGFAPVLDSIVDTAKAKGAIVSVSYVDYVGDDLDVNMAASTVLDALLTMEADLIVPVALSYSANGLLDELYCQADARRMSFAKVPIMVDPPHGASTMKPVRWLSRLVSIVPLPVIQKMFIDAAPLPSPKNIGNVGNFASITAGAGVRTYQDYQTWVAGEAEYNLHEVPHSPGLYRAQVAQMASYRGPSESFVRLVRPVYIVCTSYPEPPDNWTVYEEEVDPGILGHDGAVPVSRPNNDTVVQPDAVDRFIDDFGGTNIRVIAVRSTHCGFYERPVAWAQAFSDATAQAVDGGAIH